MALNFPANPSDGDTYENYVYDNTVGVWRRVPSSGNINSLDDVAIDSPQGGDSLVYDDNTNSWTNQAVSVEVYDISTDANEYFALPVGTDVQRPAEPANGYIRFNSESGEPEWYSEEFEKWSGFKDNLYYTVDYLLVAGGGGGGQNAGGGGAGGYFNSSFTISQPLESYSVTIGAGGASAPAIQTSNVNGSNGNDTSFDSFITIGGGGGASSKNNVGLDGGSGGGTGRDSSLSGGAALQPSSNTGGYGNPGGSGQATTYAGGGGGGGAGSAGGNGSPSGPAGTGGNPGDYYAGNGGDGKMWIDGEYYAGGGGGGSFQVVPSALSTSGLGGIGGGGIGGNDGEDRAGYNTAASFRDATAGEANTGGGGGAAITFTYGSASPKAGGSGVVVFRYPKSASLNVGAGLSSTTSTVGDYKITKITAGSDTVTFS